MDVAVVVNLVIDKNLIFKNQDGRQTVRHVRGRYTESDSAGDRTSSQYGADADRGAYWHNLVNTTEPSLCSSNAALLL